MPKVDPSAGVVTDALNQMKDSLAAGYGSGATSTHHRKLVLTFFTYAVEDPRGAPNAEFDPDTTYTKLGARGIELAVATYTKFLHDPANRIALVAASGDVPAPASIVLPSDREDAAREMIVDCVDQMLAYIAEGDDQFITIWGISKATYTPTWLDTDEDGIDDADEAPMSIAAPVLSAADRVLTTTTGAWTGTPTAYEYTWYQDGVVIEDETTNSYTVPDVDEGAFSVSVRASNAHGESEQAILSNEVDVEVDGG